MLYRKYRGKVVCVTQYEFYKYPTKMQIHNKFNLQIPYSTKTLSVYAKPLLSQVNDRQNLSATGRNFGFTCHNVYSCNR